MPAIPSSRTSWSARPRRAIALAAGALVGWVHGGWALSAALWLASALGLCGLYAWAARHRAASLPLAVLVMVQVTSAPAPRFTVLLVTVTGWPPAASRNFSDSSSYMRSARFLSIASHQEVGRWTGGMRGGDCVAIIVGFRRSGTIAKGRRDRRPSPGGVVLPGPGAARLGRVFDQARPVG